MKYKLQQVHQYHKNDQRDNNFTDDNNPESLVIKKSSFKKPADKTCCNAIDGAEYNGDNKIIGEADLGFIRSGN